MKTDVIIPAYNESERLADSLGVLYREPWVNELIIIDDGSKDDTFQIAKRYSQKVYRHQKNLGKMAAVYTGLEHVSSEYVVILDGDLGKSAVEGKKLLLPLVDKRIDMTIAILPTMPRKGFGIVKKRAKQVVLNKTGFVMNAPLSGQRAFHSSWIPKILSKNGYGYGLEIYLNLLFLTNGAIIKEIKTNMYHRTTGKNISGFYHRAKQWIEMEKTLWNYS